MSAHADDTARMKLGQEFHSLSAEATRTAMSGRRIDRLNSTAANIIEQSIGTVLDNGATPMIIISVIRSPEGGNYGPWVGSTRCGWPRACGHRSR